MEKSYWNKNGKNQDLHNHLWAELVPAIGVAETKEGELLRAMGKLYYRWYNDGDKVEPTLSWQAKDSSVVNAWGYIYSYEDLNSNIQWSKLAEKLLDGFSSTAYETILEEIADTVIEYVSKAGRRTNNEDFLDEKFAKVYPFDYENDEEEEEW